MTNKGAVPNPIKRHEHLKPLSRDHHQGLLLCWKIKMGLRHQMNPQRIAAYVRWFNKHFLRPHFALEEDDLFPILGGSHPMVQQALKEHHTLQTGITSLKTTEELQQWQQGLKEHIRFEERQLFNEIEKKASPEQLERMAQIHKGQQEMPHTKAAPEEWTDAFWLKPKTP